MNDNLYKDLEDIAIKYNYRFSYEIQKDIVGGRVKFRFTQLSMPRNVKAYIINSDDIGQWYLQIRHSERKISLVKIDFILLSEIDKVMVKHGIKILLDRE